MTRRPEAGEGSQPRDSEPSAARASRLGVRWLPWVVALGGGVMWGLQFGREGNLLAPWWALVPFFYLLGHPKAGRLGLVHGMATWATAMSWIGPTLVTYGALSPWLGVLGIGIVALLMGTFHGLAARASAALWQRGGLLGLLGPAAVWVCCEWLRTQFPGFPWNLAAYAWVEVPGALASTAWIGSYGLSFLVLFTNACLARAAFARRWEPLAVGVLVPLALFSVAERASVAADAAAPAPSLPVRLIQPNIPNRVPFDARLSQRDYTRLIDRSQRACNERGALIVWPESAAFPYMFGRDATLEGDLADLRAAGCAVLLNSPSRGEEGEWYNSAVLTGPGQPDARYDKQHLVPFGEYVPFRGLFPWFDSLTRNAGDFTAAKEAILLPWWGERIGVSICYEVVFASEVADRVDRGATVLATITNDAWYGDTFAPWQHFRAARFRAAEVRRTMLRAAITGVSGVIAPNGQVLARSEVEEELTLSTRVAGRTDRTLFSRWPHLATVLSLLIALIGWAVVRRARAQPPTKS